MNIVLCHLCSRENSVELQAKDKEAAGENEIKVRFVRFPMEKWIIVKNQKP